MMQQQYEMAVVEMDKTAGDKEKKTACCNYAA